MQNPEFYKQLTIVKNKDLDSFEALNFEKIGPYNIDSLLSQSVKSQIFLAHDKNHKPFVVKILSSKFTKNKVHRDQFLQEARILKMTSHENIVEIIDQGICDQRPFLVMQFLQGICLRQFINHYTLSIHDAAEIILQLAFALSHIHSLGIIHLDLKPENIIVTENAQIKLLDFGISQFTEDENTKEVFATTDYMSPEMKSQSRDYSNSSDIYSLGVIAYELFTSKLCFGKVDLTKIQDFLAPFLKKCLAIDKNDRFSDIVDCITNLNSILKNNPIASDLSSMQVIKSMTENLFDPLIENEAIEIAFAHDQPCQNLFYTSDILPDQTLLFLVYNFSKSSLDTLYLSAWLKCATKLLVKQCKRDFNLSEFLEELNTLVFNENQSSAIQFQALELNLFKDTLRFTGSNLASLYQYCSRKDSIQTLESQGFKLGENEFLNSNIISNGFFEGDQIMMHNFSTHFALMQEQIKSFSVSKFQELHLSAANHLAKEQYASLKNLCSASQSESSLFTLQLNRID